MVFILEKNVTFFFLQRPPDYLSARLFYPALIKLIVICRPRLISFPSVTQTVAMSSPSEWSIDDNGGADWSAQQEALMPSIREPWETTRWDFSQQAFALPEHTEMSVALGATRRRYVAEEGVKKECCICSDEYISGDVVRTLHCTHEFHADCVD